MKLNQSIYSLIAGLMLMWSACTPEEYDMGKKTYESGDLVQGSAYTVTVEGNKVLLKSNLAGCTPLWVTPQGRSQEDEFAIELPFAGSYEVTFGAETPGGVVYGEPYTFTLPKNDFSLLEDEKWFLLADKDFRSGDALPDAETLAAGISKKWYPCDANYGIGQCSGPVMYLAPYDPDGDGAGYTPEEEKNGVYKDIIFGTGNWKPNWDPGFQSWLIPEDDPYMDSYMTFSMDAANGCVATMYRGEAGTKGSSTGVDMAGKFNMNLTDKVKPLISFTDCYAMHNVGFDEVCSNYTQDIQIIELTPYILQLVTKRTNSEGNWYLVWNFVSEEVIKTKGECIPKEESGKIEKVAPVLPIFDNLPTDLFTTEINGVTYVGNQMNFNLDLEAPYDWLWWNGSPNAQQWESVTGGSYNDTWAPVAGIEAEDFELILSKASDGTYGYECGEASGKVAIANGVLTFDKEITILTATSDQRTVAVTGNTFTVLKVEAGEALTIGVPESRDENGEVNSYLVANLLYKKITTGPTGPTEIKVDNSKLEVIFGDGNPDRLRIQLYNSWGGKNECLDITKVKLKKNQTLTIKYKVLGGITWNEGAAPKTVIMENKIENAFEDGCYDLGHASNFDTAAGAVQTVSLTNTTGATQTFETDCCLVIGIQNKGLATVETLEDGNPNVQVEVVSMTIE
ncbi:hypothetical protein [Bacteroides rodentium]|uniref:hypothetical protein n=1 Tax=Bacteroides rodentium TaxID=691816 RepID=UPI00046F12C8|nr:hypothetical protein [Bacteroides rodentium]